MTNYNKTFLTLILLGILFYLGQSACIFSSKPTPPPDDSQTWPPDKDLPQFPPPPMGPNQTEEEFEQWHQIINQYLYTHPYPTEEHQQLGQYLMEAKDRRYKLDYPSPPIDVVKPQFYEDPKEAYWWGFWGYVYFGPNPDPNNVQWQNYQYETPWHHYSELAGGACH